jgi:hypothetical protein
MSNRLNRAVIADDVADDDDMTKMLIASHYNRQNGHTLEHNHQQKKKIQCFPYLLQYLKSIRKSHTRKITLNLGCTNVPKIQEPRQNSTRHYGEMNQVPY